MSDILMIGPMHPVCMEEIAKLGTVHRLWEAKDKEAMLDEIGPKIEIVATDGHHGCRPDLMKRLPNLKLISSYGVGYDNIDVPAANAHGARVSNTPDVLNDAMAEITVGLMVALARRIPEADAYTRAGDWAGKGNFPLTAELTGATAGILGLGRIGKEIARRLVPMKMQVVYHGRREQKDQPYRYFPSLIEMAKAADWLVVITPGTSETTKLVDAEVLKALGPEGALVNVARGAVVDEAALVEALKSGTLGGAALDVFEEEPRPHPELLTMPRTILSPHQGSATRRTRQAMGQLVVDNIKAHLKGAPLLTEVKE
ncbi:2-hydroxyacid dehydrogenase [Pikeienuella piscinae]|uniref:2-hydroxyacid dehydrogenase n=1 Tax=Pikeienuella piscinae TaxID=2748098 RepID=A0A7L5BZD2_9RHOB|nr:2-hydroxyacid dehydrogenase [Pikeienuella piscinae]QIE54959.1 2-hydroxyacid dehydrogenase [Pikeienuella piscinae]